MDVVCTRMYTSEAPAVYKVVNSALWADDFVTVNKWAPFLHHLTKTCMTLSEVDEFRAEECWRGTEVPTEEVETKYTVDQVQPLQ